MATLLPSISVSSKISNSIIDVRGGYDISCQIWILHIVVWCIYWMLWVCTCIHSLISNFIEGVGLFSSQTNSSCFLPSSNISSPRLWMKLNPLLNQRCPLIPLKFPRDNHHEISVRKKPNISFPPCVAFTVEHSLTIRRPKPEVPTMDIILYSIYSVTMFPMNIRHAFLSGKTEWG